MYEKCVCLYPTLGHEEHIQDRYAFEVYSGPTIARCIEFSVCLEPSPVADLSCNGMIHV